MNRRVANGSTKFYTFIDSGDCDAETTRKLLDAGANPNIKSNGKFPIYAAIKKDMLDVVKVLAKYNADVDLMQDNKWTPFRYAVYKNKYLIVAALIPYTKAIYNISHNPMVLSLVAKHKNTKTANVLVNSGTKINPFCGYSNSNNGKIPSPLYNAAIENNDTIVSFLVTHRADPDITYHHNLPLIVAIFNQNVNMVKTLIKHGTSLWKKRKYLACSRMGLNNGFGQSYETEDLPPKTPLHIAAYVGNPVILKYLLKHKAYYDIYGEYGYRPISRAAQKGNLDAVKLLIKAKSSVNRAKKEIMPPLHCAVMSGNIEVVKTLIDAGANIMAVNNIGWYPIHIAAYFGYLDILKYIMLKTQKVDIRTSSPRSMRNYRFTPIQLAAYANKPIIVSALIDAGANIKLGTKYGVTPLGIAEYMHNDDVAKILISNKASSFNSTYYKKSKINHIHHRDLYSWKSGVRRNAELMDNRKKFEYKL